LTNDNTNMNRPSYQNVLKALCLTYPDLVKSDGTVNHNAVSRATKIPQPTISRALRGEVDSPSGKVSDSLCAFFGVSLDQLSGGAEVKGLFPDGKYSYPRTVSIGIAEEKDFAGSITPVIGKRRTKRSEAKRLIAEIPMNDRMALLKALSETLSTVDASEAAALFSERVRRDLSKHGA